MKAAHKTMKNGISAGSDGIIVEVLKYAGTKTWTILAKIYKKCVRNQYIQDHWNAANIILIHKKGSKDDIKNILDAANLESIASEAASVQWFIFIYLRN